MSTMNLCRNFRHIAARKLSNESLMLRRLLTVKFFFIEAKSGQKIPVEGEEGKTLLDVALKYDIDIEGACGGELACSTCHVIVPDELFKKLPPKKEEEDDMLDLAWGLTKTSRLCCQLKVTEAIEGGEFTVPAETNLQS